jgi:hypothetical protein
MLFAFELDKLHYDILLPIKELQQRGTVATVPQPTT